jgi:hypothetical protein
MGDLLAVAIAGAESGRRQTAVIAALREGRDAGDHAGE